MKNYKIINYFGVQYQVPLWVKYIITNFNGGIWGFEKQPIYDLNLGFWVNGGKQILLNEQKYHWTESLIKVE